MPVQARASATRQKIIDAAAELFADQGFGETGPNDIAARAGITTGAFYYHFRSKEDLADAIIEQSWLKAWSVFANCVTSPTAGLENVIVMTFSLSDLMKRDKSVWVAHRLSWAIGQHNGEGSRASRRRAVNFVNGVADSIRRNDIRDDVTSETVGNMMWIAVHGCHLLSEAMMDNVFTRLAESWRMLLPAIVTEESLPYFQKFLARIATQFEPLGIYEVAVSRQTQPDDSAERTGSDAENAISTL